MFTFIARTLRQLKNDKRGVSAIEYGVLASVIGAGVAVAAANYVSGLEWFYGNLNNGMQAVVPIF